MDFIQNLHFVCRLTNFMYWLVNFFYLVHILSLKNDKNHPIFEKTKLDNPKWNVYLVYFFSSKKFHYFL